MNNKIKALILIGAIAFFTEVFRLVNSARVNLDNKNNCVKGYETYFKNKGYEKYMIRPSAYEACK